MKTYRAMLNLKKSKKPLVSYLIIILISEKALDCVLLEETGLDAKYWLEAAYLIAYTKNRIRHTAHVMTPFEALYGKNPDLKYVREFCCLAFVYNHNWG